MKCEKIQSRLHRFLQDELPAGEARRMECHLRECEACRRARREAERLNSLLDEARGQATAPAGFTRRVRRRAEAREVAGIRWLAPVASVVGPNRVRAAVAAVFLFAGLSAGAFLGWSTAAVSGARTGSTARAAEQEDAVLVGGELAAAPPGSLTDAYLSVSLNSSNGVDVEFSGQ